MKYEIRIVPSQVYGSRTVVKEALNERYVIIDFRPPQKGELFLNSLHHVEVPENDFPLTCPRFIVQENFSDQLNQWWE